MDREIAEKVNASAGLKSATELAQSVPGIQKTAAASLVAEIGPDMSRFPSASKLASWVGICPGNNESAGKRNSGKTRKGNPWVRRILVECAWSGEVRLERFPQKRLRNQALLRTPQTKVAAQTSVSGHSALTH